jgi:hypothetical protein
MDVVRIVRYLFGLVGAGLLIGALLLVQNTRSFLADAVSAQGVVLELVGRSSSDSSGTSYTYAPMVQFETTEGRAVTFVSSTSSNPPSYRVGETVEVLYPADEPERARLHGWFSLWGAAAILGGMGTVFSTISVGLTVGARRSRRKGRTGPAGQTGQTGPAGQTGPTGLHRGPEGPQERPPRVDLVTKGVLVEADVQRVEPTHRYLSNGSAIYRIVAQWLDPDMHEVCIFTSEDIPFDPTKYLTGTTVKVYIAPDDRTQNYMDLSFLPKAAR